MKNWKKTIVLKDLSIHQAIKKMDKAGLRILLVCNKNDNLLGVVTDGDIRRAIIDRIDFNLPIKKIMSRKPITGKHSDNFDTLQKKMAKFKIIHLPIVRTKKIINLITHNYEIVNDDLDYTVLILAGGYGKRLRPLTKKIPKPLVKVNGNTVIQSLISKLEIAGFKNFFVSVFYKSAQIKRSLSKKNSNIHFLTEKTPLGTAGSIGLIPKKFLTKSIIVLNADIITEINFHDLLKYHTKSRNDATIVAKKYEIQSPYAELEVKKNKIINLTEKPNYSSLINAGIYVLSKSFVKDISGKKKIDMTEVIKSKIKRNATIGYYPIYENWIDIGNYEDLSKARKKNTK